VIEMADRLGADDREAFEERAAIIEYDGQLPRAHAECLALLEVLRRNARAVEGLQVLQVEIDGGTEWVLTTDLAFAREHTWPTSGAGKSPFSIPWASSRSNTAASQFSARSADVCANPTILYG
jgi:hypothetical protein